MRPRDRAAEAARPGDRRPRPIADIVRPSADAAASLDALLDALHGPDRGPQIPGHFGNGTQPVSH